MLAAVAIRDVRQQVSRQQRLWKKIYAPGGGGWKILIFFLQSAAAAQKIFSAQQRRPSS